jgi:F420-dependent oxidoreductase-like protein
MKLGLQIPSFTWPGGPATLGPTLGEIARAAETAGYESLWVMDHVFQIGQVGAVDEPMLEAYTTLGYLAALTRRARLGVLVTGVTYRHTGLLVKTVTTLDVLSGGRAWLGIGAAWYEREHLGLGVTFPPVRERFERLEETLRIARQMWRGDTSPFEGKHYALAEPINQPPALSRPHPPVLIGGSGERKTLRLVAKYADACNLFGDPDTARRKLAILREHCEREGRDYDTIEKTVYFPMNASNATAAALMVEQLERFAEAGVQAAIGPLENVASLAPFEVVEREIMPRVTAL